MKTAKKALLIFLCIVLTMSASVFGTLAYLTSTTGTVTNTFTIGKVDITLPETGAEQQGDGSYKKEYSNLLPGTIHAKDPKVTVTAGSEDCYVFLKVIEVGANPVITITDADANTTTTTNVFEYEITGWTELVFDGNKYSGVYYKEVTKSENNQSFGILKDNQVKVSEYATSEHQKEIAGPNGDGKFSLSFQAAAVQKNDGGIDSLAEAWAQLPADFTNGVSKTPVTP